MGREVSGRRFRSLHDSLGDGVVSWRTGGTKMDVFGVRIKNAKPDAELSFPANDLKRGEDRSSYFPCVFISLWWDG